MQHAAFNLPHLTSNWFRLNSSVTKRCRIKNLFYNFQMQFRQFFAPVNFNTTVDPNLILYRNR